MTVHLALGAAAALPWVVGLALAGSIDKPRVARWAWNTGMPIDDARGAMAHTELIRTARVRRAGGLVGSAAFGATILTGDDDATSFILRLGLALAGYGIGVVIAELTRVPSGPRRRVVGLTARQPGDEVGRGARSMALGLVGFGIIAMVAALVRPGGADRWPMVVTLLALPIWPSVMVWAERLPRWGADEVEADVLAAFRVAGVRVLWALSATTGLAASLAGVVTVLQIQRWSGVVALPVAIMLQVLVRAATGQREYAAGWTTGRSAGTGPALGPPSR